MINKPINPSPYNCCVDMSEDICIKYEIPNNETIDGRYIFVSDLSDGSVVLDSYETFSEPTNVAEWDITSSLPVGEEYSWSSFYWQTPIKEEDKLWTVSNIDIQTGAIHLKPDGAARNTLSPVYKLPSNGIGSGFRPTDSMIEDWDGEYNKTIFNSYCGHEFGDDTSSRCSNGVLEDYFGFSCFCTGASLYRYISQIGLGKCVINIFDKDNKLVARARCLAYDYDRDGEPFKYYIIVDNKNFVKLLKSKFGTNKVVKEETLTQTSYYGAGCIPYNYVRFYNIEDLSGQADISGIINYGDLYCYIEDCEYSKHEYILSTRPSMADKIQIGDKIKMWSRENANFNITPPYYFRTKTSPIININAEGLEDADGVKVLKDVKCKVNLNCVSSYCKLNYFYWYLYVLNPETNDWVLKEHSPMIKNVTSSYDFVGFANGQTYKICAVCTDNDSDEWTAEELQFTVDNPPLTPFCIPARFNKQNTTVEVTLTKLLDVYRNFSLEFYRVLKDDLSPVVNLEYAGGGLCKTGGEYGVSDDTTHIYNGNIIPYDTWLDYNIKNDATYDYYVRVSYTGRNYSLSNGNLVEAAESYNTIGDEDSQGVDFFLITTNLHTEFEGTSILGLERTANTNLKVLSQFNLFYRFEKNMSELTNEISREYINSFGKYPKELKGHQNYISSQCSGLLGNETKGVYAEPKGIRDAWVNFVNDDSIKLYRGLDGKTMVVSIETSRIKPEYYPGVGIVNEVHITFKEIAPTNKYAIFGTEKTGE